LVRVQCPHCQRRYRTELEAFGRTAVCSKCYQTFQIGESRPPFEWKQTDIAEDSWIGVEPPEEKQELKHCIHCDAPLEAGAARCLACGANQITGVVERGPLKPSDRPASGPSHIPVRPIVIGLAVLIVGAGLWWLLRSMTESAAKMGDALADQTLVLQAGKRIRAGDDAESLARAFGGRVTDDNLPRFLRLLSSADAESRQVGAMLIGCGQISDVGPIVALAEARETAQAGREALEAIGVRRLVALTTREPARARESAARALCLLFELKCDSETIRKLSEPAGAASRVEVLNGLCGTWPHGTGRFVVTIDETASPFTVTVEQVGGVFYLEIGGREFCSSISGRRRFEIPLDLWCSATGTAVDAAAVRALLTGSVTLEPVIGGGWQGTVRVTAKQTLHGPLPGFLPIGFLERGRTTEAVIRLPKATP
jgi:hypothetical protein